MDTNPIYDFLKQNGLTQKDEASFLQEYSDSAKAQELHKFFQDNNLTQKGFDEFYGTYLKKKDGGSVSSPSVPASVSETPSTSSDLDEIRQAVELGRKTKYKAGEAIGGGMAAMGTGADGGYVPDEAAVAESQKKAAQLQGKGYTELEKIYEDFQGIPKVDNSRFQQLLQERQENPQAFQRTKAAFGWQSPLFRAIEQKEGAYANNVKQALLNRQKVAGTYDEARMNTREIVNTINHYGDGDRDQLLKNLAQDKAFSYGLATTDDIYKDEKYDQVPDLNVYQRRYLQFLEDVDPAQHQAYMRLLSAPPDSESGQLAQQLKHREMEQQGMALERKALEEKLKEFVNRNNKAGLAPQEKQAYQDYLSRYNELSADMQTQGERYPQAAAIDADRVAQEALGQKNGAVKRFFLGVGENVDDAVNLIGDIVQAPFRSEAQGIADDWEDLGDKKLTQQGQFVPSTGQMLQPDYQLRFSDALQKKIDAVKKDDSLTDEEKRSQVQSLVLQNGEGVSWQPNANGGKFNLTANSIFNGMSTTASEIASTAAISYLTGGFGNVGKARELSTLFGSTFATAYNDYYTEALDKNIPNPTAYAITHTTIEAASELINNDIEMVKKLAGGGSTFGKILGKVSKEEWEVISKIGRSRFSKFGEALKNMGANALSNAYGETKEEVAGQIAGNVADKYVFNQDAGTFDGLKATVVNTFVPMLFMGVGGVGGQVKSINRMEQHALYEVAQKPAFFLQKLDEDVQNGTVAPQDAEKIKANIQTVSSLVETTEGTTDNERAADLAKKYVSVVEPDENRRPQVITIAPKEKPAEEKRGAKVILPQSNVPNEVVDLKRGTGETVSEPVPTVAAEQKEQSPESTTPTSAAGTGQAGTDGTTPVLKEKGKEKWPLSVDEEENGLSKKIGKFTYAGLDLKGDTRELWMMPYKGEKTDVQNGDLGVTEKGELGKAVNPAAMQKEMIKDALNEGKYEKAIDEGRMSPAYAKRIIESAGLEVPQDILIDAGLQENVANKNKTNENTLQAESPLPATESPAENSQGAKESSGEKQEPKVYDYKDQGDLKKLKAQPGQIMHFKQGNGDWGDVTLLVDEDVKKNYKKGSIATGYNDEKTTGPNELKDLAKKYRKKGQDIIIDLRSEKAAVHARTVEKSEQANPAETKPTVAPKPKASAKLRELADKIEKGDIAGFGKGMEGVQKQGASFNPNKVAAEALRAIASVVEAAENAGEKLSQTKLAQLIDEGWEKVRQHYNDHGAKFKNEEAYKKDFYNYANEAFAEEPKQFKHAATQEMREEKGLPPYEKKRKSDAERDAEAAAMQNDEDIQRILGKLMTKDGITDAETVAVGKYLVSLDADVRANPTPEKIAYFGKIADLLDAAGSDDARAFRARKTLVTADESIARQYDLRKKARENGGGTFTEEDIADVKARYEAYEQKLAEEKAAREKAEKQYRDLQANRAMEEAKKRAQKGKENKAKRDFKKERDDLKEQIKKKWKENGEGNGELYALPIPIPITKIKQLAAVAPDVAKLMKSYVEEGVSELTELVNKIHGDLSVPGLEKDDVLDIIAGKYDNIKEVKVDPEKKLVQVIQKATEEKLKLEAKTKQKVFDKPKKQTSWIDDPEYRRLHPDLYNAALDAIRAKEDAKHELALANLKAEMEAKHWTDKRWDDTKRVLRTAKALRAGIDDSGLGVQTLWLGMANPVSFARAIASHVRAAFSPTYFERELTRMHNSSWWPLVEKSGLSVVDPKSLKVEEMNEIFNDTYWDRMNLTIGGKKVNIAPTKPFERAFTQLGNSLRVNVFLRQAEQLEMDGVFFEENPEEYLSLAKVVNNMSGRGTMTEKLQRHQELLSSVLWSPKLLASSANILGMGEFFGNGYYRSLTPRMRWYAAQQMAKGIGSGVAVMMLAGFGAAAMGAEVEWDLDPTSVTFGTLRIDDYHYTIFGRYNSLVRQLAMVITRKKKSGIKEDDLMDERGSTIQKETDNFIRGKANPTLGLGWDVYTGKTYDKQDVTLTGEIKNAFMPMAVDEFLKAAKQDGMAGVFVRGIPSFFGAKVSNEKDFLSQNSFGTKARINGVEQVIPDEQFYPYAKKRKEIESDAMKQLRTKGYPVLENGEVKVRRYHEMTDEQKKAQEARIAREASQKAKEAVFGSQKPPRNEKRENKMLQRFKKRFNKE